MAFPAYPSLALVRRELITLLRGRRAWLFLALFVGGCMSVAVMAWPEVDAWTAPRPELATVLFTTICAAMAAGAVLLLPGIAALSLVAERDQDTYDQLRLTLISNAGIVMAKFVNVLGFYLLLCVAALPVMGVVFFTVGLDLRQVFLSVAGLVMLGATCASVGLFAGSVVSRPIGAIICAYLSVVVCGVLGTAILGNLRSSSILNAFTIIAAGGAMLNTFCLYLAKDILQPGSEPKQVSQKKPIDDPEVLDKRRKRFPFYLVDPLRRKDMIPDGQNPMLVKEIRWGFMTRTTIAIRVFYISLIAYSIVGLVAAWPHLWMWNAADAAARSILAQTILTLALCPALMANSFTKERELGNLDMLRMTLLTPRQIIFGKCAAGALAAGPVLVAATLTFFPLLLMLRNEHNAAIVLLAGYPTLLVCVWVSLCLGVYCSLQTKRTIAALTLNYLLNVAVFAGAQIGLRAWRVLSYAQQVVMRQASDEMEDIVAVLSPITAFERCADALRHSDLHWLGYWGIGMLVFVALGWCVIAASTSSYRHAHAQDK